MKSPGVFAALGSALLSGAATPLAKLLLDDIDPWLLASLLYLGSGLGLAAYRLVRGGDRSRQLAKLAKNEWRWLAGAVVAGGIVGPVLLMYGLTRLPASSASLLLNAEGAFTALLAWFVFRENFDLRIAGGMTAILLGATILAWPTEAAASMEMMPVLSVLGACLAWGVDNNLTRKVSLADPTWIACVKGLVAGATNLFLAFAFVPHGEMPVLGSLASIGGALLLGCLAYGVSLSLFIVSLRHLGTARTGAYFSVAPFFGATLSVVMLHEALTTRLAAAGVSMAIGVWLHLTEKHSHRHIHEALEHEHEHEHDEHHRHEHESADGQSGHGRHTHRHRHEPIAHSHAHYPDAHHRHEH
jgi:drug/metabolite transporter (DMT)-like permease